jgi:DNA-binding transcriptional regulator YiaG
MPNIAAALKSEIARVSRKEIRGEAGEMKKASAQHRASIADLRKRIELLERQLKRAKRDKSERAVVSEEETTNIRRRFSPSRLASTRKRLGVSAADFGALIGVTGQSIYKWESGDARPRAKQLDAIASVRAIGKREVRARVAALRSAA